MNSLRKTWDKVCKPDVFTACALKVVSSIYLVLSVLSIITSGLVINQVILEVSPLYPLGHFLLVPAYIGAIVGFLVVAALVFMWWYVVQEEEYNIRIGILLQGLFLVFALAVLAIALCIMFQESTDKRERFMQVAIVQYRTDEYFTRRINSIQSALECCGVKSFRDWEQNIDFKCSFSSRKPTKCSVPSSCCINKGYLNDLFCGIGALNAPKSPAAQLLSLTKKSASALINTSGCLQKAHDKLGKAGLDLVLFTCFYIVITVMSICTQYNMLRYLKLRKCMSRRKPESCFYVAHSSTVNLSLPKHSGRSQKHYTKKPSGRNTERDYEKEYENTFSSDLWRFHSRMPPVAPTGDELTCQPSSQVSQQESSQPLLQPSSEPAHVRLHKSPGKCSSRYPCKNRSKRTPESTLKPPDQPITPSDHPITSSSQPIIPSYQYRPGPSRKPSYIDIQAIPGCSKNPNYK